MAIPIPTQFFFFFLISTVVADAYGGLSMTSITRKGGQLHMNDYKRTPDPGECEGSCRFEQAEGESCDEEECPCNFYSNTCKPARPGNCGRPCTFAGAVEFCVDDCPCDFVTETCKPPQAIPQG